MSKEYEKQIKLGEMIRVKFDTDVKYAQKDGTYKGTIVQYEDVKFNKTDKLSITQQTFSIKKNLRSELEAVSEPDTKFTIHQYREVGAQYWNTDKVTQGHTTLDAPAPSSARGKTIRDGGFNNGPNPAAVGQAINLAVELGLAKSYEGFTPNVIRNAIDKYKTLKEEFTANWEAATKEPSPPPVQKAAAVGHDSFDEDCPF